MSRFHNLAAPADRNLQRAYYALTAIALLAIIGFLVLNRLVAQEADIAQMINVSGGQRMYSQRIALFGRQMVVLADKRDLWRSRMLETVAAFEQTHEALIAQPMTAAMRQLYYDEPYLIDQQVRQYVEETRLLADEPDDALIVDNPHLQRMIALATGDLVDALDRAVAEYQIEAQIGLSNIRTFQDMLALVVVLALVGTGWFTFRPMLNRLRLEAEQLNHEIERRKRSEQLYRAIMQSLPNAGVLVFDHDLRFLIVEGPVLATFGYDRAKMLGKSLREVVPPHTADTLEPQYRTALEGTSFSFEFSSRGAFFFIQAVPLIGNEGAVYAAMFLIQDISETKRIQLEIEASEHRFRSLAEAAFEGIVFHQDGIISDTNIRMNDLFGYQRDELIGRSIFDLIAPESQQVVREHLTHEAPAPYEAMGRRKDDRAFPIEIASKMIASPDGKAFKVKAIRDITERKEAEARLRQAMANLEAVNQDLKDFAYIISHDLKAPLRAIGSLSGWLAADYADRLDDDGKELLALLQQRVTRMDALIDGVLQYSRVGRTSEERRLVDFNKVVAEVIATLNPPEQMTIRVETPLPTLTAESTRMEQIFQNLIGNAIKFNDKPAGEVRVGALEDDDCWRFYVADNGPGIEEKHFNKVFQIFQTLHPRDAVESTGVGLAIVKRIIELYGGKIWIESTLGDGSTFWFTLPKD